MGEVLRLTVVLGRLPPLAIVKLHPVILSILDLASALESLSEQVAKVVVIWGILKSKVADVAEVLVKLLWEAIAQLGNWGSLLLFSDLLVFLLVGCSLESLPWETSAEKVHEDVAEGLEIVTAGLLTSEMGVDRHITSSSGERLSLTIRDVLFGLWVAVLLGHAKVNGVDDISRLGPCSADKEVVWLDIAVDEVLLVDSLDSRQLRRSLEDRWNQLIVLLTICLATMTTVLMEKRLLQWSKRSSRDGPSRSITKMLWRPSWPK